VKMSLKTLKEKTPQGGKTAEGKEQGKRGNTTELRVGMHPQTASQNFRT